MGASTGRGGLHLVPTQMQCHHVWELCWGIMGRWLI